MEEKFKKVKEILQKYGQEHLLLKYDELSNENKELLLDQILNIDFEEVNELYEQTKKKIDVSNIKIEPIDFIEKSKITEEEKANYEKIGNQIMAKGKYAVVTMAGGQGTRLGHNGPKGTFNIGLDSHKPIFEILCDTLKQAKERCGEYVVWYLMTSKENNKQTMEFFEKENYFGYPKEKIRFFIQGELPMLDLNGKILLDENGLVKLAANGHGGTLVSIGKEKVLDEMKKEGIEWIFVSGVDNVLAKLSDPLLLGMTVKNEKIAAVKSVEKTNPKEKVGVFCRKDGKVGVVEYTEISDEMAELRSPEGGLVYGDLNAVFHLYNIKALEQVIDLKLPYHIAVKKATYIDEHGKLIVPQEPNAYKFETFIFDSFEMLEDVLVLRVKREEEFAPVKNAQGEDSPETARKLYNAYHQK